MNLTIIIITVVVSIAAIKRRDLFDKLKLSPYRMVYCKEWYRIISHAFVHADYMHLAVNMIVLYSFGEVVETLFKTINPTQAWMAHLHYILLYFGGVAVASVSTIRKQKDVYDYAAVGASGAVSAVLFAFIFFAPWEMIYFFGIIPIPGILFGPLYLWYSSYMARRGGGNVNHEAHFYGALFGFFYPLITHPSLINRFFRALFMQ